jgi:hypothetical protein
MLPVLLDESQFNHSKGVFANLAECEFSDEYHHSTPTQRRAAAEWGNNLANDAQKQGRILPSREFARLFDAAFGNIAKH